MDRTRCSWCNCSNTRYVKYHDEEWGVPTYEDDRLFELLILELFQAGLSWETILNKREGFRQAFDGFDAKRICRYDETKIQELMQNAEIIRNRRKIEAAINNAQTYLEIKREWGSFSHYIWHFTDGKILYETGKASSPLSDLVAKDMKRRGMKFIGTTIVYAYLQAIGVINSHETGCFQHVMQKERV